METITQAQLTASVIDTMEDELRVSKKQAADFIESLKAVLEESVGDGKKVNVWGIVTLTPSFKMAKPKRKGVDPRTGEERTLDPVPAKVAVKAGVAKRIKDALPEPTSKAGKSLKAEAVARAEAAAERKAQREADEAKAAKKAEREAKKSNGEKKSSGKKSSGKKK